MSPSDDNHTESNQTDYPAILPKNIIISPFSLYILLSLFSTGVSGLARFELDLVLERHFNEARYDQEVALIIDSLLSSSFGMVNVMLVDSNLPLNGIFAYHARRNFHAEIMAMDTSKPDKTVELINARTRDITYGYIDPAIDNDLLIKNSQLVLLNVAYLNASWSQGFDVQRTAMLPFYVDENTPPRRVPMMRLSAELQYGEHERFTVIHLCLHRNEGTETEPGEQKDDYVMTVLLPHRDQTLDSIERKLFWLPLLSANACKEYKRFVHLHLPRFNVTSQLSLIKPLQHMGVKEIFNPASQQENITEGRFDYMFASTATTDNLIVKQIEQRVRIEVNEAGLIAGAATTLGVTTRIAGSANYIKVNRPFMYLVWHLDTQSVLFSGSVRDPTQT